MTLLTPEVSAIFERAQFAKLRTNIPNEHPSVASVLPRLAAICSELGFDIADTGYTFTVKKTVGRTDVYQPVVALTEDGVLSLFWGKLVKPLSEIPVPYVIEESDEGKPSVTFELPGLDDVVSIGIMTVKNPEGKYPKTSEVRAANKKGKLEGVIGVRKQFEAPAKLSELEPGEYYVIDYHKSEYEGQTKFSIRVTTRDGVDMGLYRANSAIARKLLTDPEISANDPAPIIVHPSTEKTGAGHPIVPVDFLVPAELSLPVFEFV